MSGLKQAPRKEETVVLEREHEHRGRKYPVGAELTLAADKAEWLRGKGVARRKGEPVPGAADTAPTKQ